MKSITSKIVMMFLALMFCTFVLISAFLYGFLGDYFEQREGGILLRETKRLAAFTTDIMTAYPHYDNTFLRRLFENNIETSASSSGAIIVVFNAEKGIVFCTGEREFTTKDFPPGFADRILGGTEISQISDLHSKIGSSALIAAVPVMVEGTAVAGVVSIFPIPYLDDLRADVLYMIIMAMLISTIIATTLAIIFSRRLIKPVISMSKSARQIASGNFGSRVKAHSRDEIGALAHSFNYMADCLENLENMRSSFVSNVSHELRTPMTIMQGFLEGILDGTIDQGKQNEYLEIVISESKRLSRMVNDLLDIAKIESGALPISPMDFNINELVRRTMLTFEKRITEKNLNATVSLSAHDVYVYADMDMITRVLTNLFDNAVKFTDTGGTLDIVQTIKNRMVCISIRNSGEGISAQDLKYIWDRFYKTDPSRSKDKTGTGLGLFIVKNLVTQNGGTITAKSVPNEYTTFTFCLKEGIKKIGDESYGT